MPLTNCQKQKLNFAFFANEVYVVLAKNRRKGISAWTPWEQKGVLQVAVKKKQNAGFTKRFRCLMVLAYLFALQTEGGREEDKFIGVDVCAIILSV